MGGLGKAEYVALIAKKDPKIRLLIQEGFEFVTNAFKAGAVPPRIKAKEEGEIARKLMGEGYQVELSTAYDEKGNPLPAMSAIWRKKA